MSIETMMKQIDGIEAAIAAHSEKADAEIAAIGRVSTDTANAIDKLGEAQREAADRLLALEQAGSAIVGRQAGNDSIGSQFVKSNQYENYQSGQTQKARVEVQMNTLTGSDTNVAPDRQGGIVPGDFHFLTLESVFPSVPTSSNAIEFTKENVFTNNAAEAAEAAEKAESAITWALVNMPVSTVAHWLKISRQLAMDNAALAAYVNQRMVYGVNRRVETQLGAGDGVAPNISGILDSGNFTAHGFADAALGTLKKVNLITKIRGALWAKGAIPDAILMNPADFSQLEVDITDSSVNATRIDYSNPMAPRIGGVPVIQSNGITADNVVVGAFRQAGTIYNREGVVVEMSDSDDDNFTKNLVTIRAERRLALTIERPSYIIAGDLTPA